MDLKENDLVVSAMDQRLKAKNHNSITINEFSLMMLSLIGHLGKDSKMSIITSSELYEALKSQKNLQWFLKAVFDERSNRLPPYHATVDDDSGHLQIFTSTFESRLKACIHTYAPLNTITDAQKSFSDLIHEFVTRETDSVEIKIFGHHWFVSPSDYSKYRLLVEDLKNAMISGLDFTHSDFNHQYLIEQDSDLAKTCTDIISIKQHVEKINDKILAEMQLLSKKWFNQFMDKFVDFYNEAIVLRQDIIKYKILFPGEEAAIKPGLLSFNKQAKEKFELYSDLLKRCDILNQQVKATIGPEHSEDVSDLSLFGDNDKLDALFNSWKAKSEHLVSERLKRTNQQNIENENLEIQVGNLRDAIDQINALNFFVQRFELNTINYYQISIFIERTLLKLEAAVNYCNKLTALNQWLKFYDKLDANEKSFVSKLIKYEEKQWEQIFVNSFTKKFLDNSNHPMTIKSLESVNEIVEAFNYMKGEVFSSYQNKIACVFASRLCNMNGAFNYLSKQLLEPKDLPLDKSSLNEIELNQVQDAAPLTLKVVPELQACNIQIDMQMQNQNFSYVFNLDVASNYDLLDDIDRRVEDIGITERFGVASNVASLFDKYATCLQIYQLKTANVLGVLPQLIAEKLAEKLAAYGLKEFRVKDKRKDSIIECIIETNRRQILITMNGLIDYKNPESLIEQRQIIDGLERLGFEVINLWSVDLLENYKNRMTSLVEKIVSGLKPL